MRINFPVFLKKQNLFLLIIILLGAYLRLPGIFGNYFAFTYDVGRDMLALWDIVHAHKLLLIGFTTGLPGVFYGPWWYYLLLFPYILSFGNPQGVALTMGLVGIATVFFGFLFGKKVGGYFLGISFAALIAVSPALISLSSQIWNPNISPLFIIFCLWTLYKIYSKDKPKLRYYFTLGLLITLIIDLEIVFGLLLAVGLTLSVLVIKNKKIQLKSIVFFLAGATVIFSPRIIFEIRHQFLMTTSFIKFLTIGDASQGSGLSGSFINRLSMMFSQFNSTLALENKFLGVIIILFVTLTIAIFYRKASKINKQFIKTSCIVFLTFLIGLTFFHHDIWPHYLVGLPVFYLLLFCLSISLIIQKTKNYIIWGSIVIILFLINLNPISIVNNLNKPAWIGDASVYKNQLEVINYVYQQSAGRSFKYVVYTPPIHDYTYQYLFKWYGPNKYHYSSSKDSRLAYFILEPDLQYPFRLTDWLKIREKDGKIIRSEKFKSGIVVQTRIH